MKYRVNARYEALIQMDVIAESVEEAEMKAREIFEACDSEDFNIGNEIDIDADPLVGVDCPDCVDGPAEPAQIGQMLERELQMDYTGDIHIHRGNIMTDIGNVDIGYDLDVEENNILH